MNNLFIYFISTLIFALILFFLDINILNVSFTNTIIKSISFFILGIILSFIVNHFTTIQNDYVPSKSSKKEDKTKEDRNFFNIFNFKT